MSVNAREISNTKRDKVLDMLVICLGKLDLSLLYWKPVLALVNRFR